MVLTACDLVSLSVGQQRDGDRLWEEEAVCFVCSRGALGLFVARPGQGSRWTTIVVSPADVGGLLPASVRWLIDTVEVQPCAMTADWTDLIAAHPTQLAGLAAQL